MKLETEKLAEKLKSEGIVVLKNFYDEKFCEDVIGEIESAIDNFKDKVSIIKAENTGGDHRLYGIDKFFYKSNLFCNEFFFKDLINKVSEKKEKPFFVIGGKLEYEKDSNKNSGGGWHRDKDEDQYKVMVYLNKVASENGPFMFIKNSKKTDAVRLENRNKQSIVIALKKFLKRIKLNNPRYSEDSIKEYLKKNNLKILEIQGDVGDVIIFNSSYLHRGKNIIDSTRYTLTTYFFPDTKKQQRAVNKSFAEFFIRQ